MNRPIDRLVSHLGTGGVLAEEIIVLPVLRRPDGSGCKPAAAVGADVLQYVVDTRGTKRALVRTDARFKRVGRQRLVAVFTRRPELQHAAPFVDGNLAPTRCQMPRTLHQANPWRSTPTMKTPRSAVDKG